MKRILFICGSVGLGHVQRDLAIVRELRATGPDLEISWLASGAAGDVLRRAGERLLPETEAWENEDASVEAVARDGLRVNLVNFLVKTRKAWAVHKEIFLKVTTDFPFDLVVGDETYEISVALKENPGLKKAPFVIIFDFIGLDSMSRNPLEKTAVFIWNKLWSKGYKKPAVHVDETLFVGEPEDIPDRRFGSFLPNRREWARCRNLKYLGYILSFDPASLADKEKLRTALGYGPAPLVVCAVGGTSIGKDLLELCGRAFPSVQEAIPGLRMTLVCGPRLDPKSLRVPRGVGVLGYVPNLQEHFAACDLAVVQGGGTTTLELTALRRPFLYFPLEGHCEQEVMVAGRLARHRAGTKVMFSETTPESLAALVKANIGKEADWPAVSAEGAKNAARILRNLLNARG